LLEFAKSIQNLLQTLIPMSYILDALKKAERERTQGQLPSLQAWLTDSAVTPKYHYRYWGVIVLLLISSSLLGFNIWQTLQPVRQLLPTAEVEANASHAVTTSITTPAPLNEPIEPVAIIPPPQPNVTAPLHSELGKALIMPEAAVPSIPLLGELPEQLWGEMLTLNLNVHVYADNPQQRFVLLNGKRYIENMQIASELYLRQIRPEDVVIEYQQQLFRLLRPGI